jgi:thiamine biosynthesis lipoprotein
MVVQRLASTLLVVAALGLLGAAVWLGSREREDGREVTGGAPAAEGASAPIRTERRLMGTLWTITVVGTDETTARATSERALDEVDRLERLLSEWMPESEISRVNQSAGVGPVRVGPELIACVKASLDVARWSDGAYDISWAALRGLWDFSATSRHVPPSADQVRARLPLWNYRNIALDEAASTVFLREPGMAIGLGGVAKGYALDRAGEILRAGGVENFMIFGGGQILAHGKRDGRPWRIGIQHPRRPTFFAYIEVGDGSISTSGDYEHAWEHEGVRYHHILDPRTGFPSRESMSVTVLAKTALWADAVDTAAFVLGREAAIGRLTSAPGGPYEAVIVDSEMRVAKTPGLDRRLTMHFSVNADGRLGEELRSEP